MRVCLLCAGAMPDPVRDDALYCSTSCKLKAQRKRKKERPQRITKEQIDSFDPVAPLGDGPQLWLPFMGRGIGDGRQFSFGFVKVVEHDGTAPSGKDASAAREEKKPEQRGLAARLWAKLSQPSKGDIV